MDVEFDAVKDAINQAKHGVSLAFGARVFDDPDAAVFATVRLEDEEERLKAVGMIDGSLWSAVFVVRQSRTRFISVRRSNTGEQRIYYSNRS